MAALATTADQQSTLYQPQAEDILSDDELLELFRAVKQILRKKPTTERISKVLFCFCYALGDEVKFFKPQTDRISFKEEGATQYSVVKVPGSPDRSVNMSPIMRELPTQPIDSVDDLRRSYSVPYITQKKEPLSKSSSKSPNSPSLPSFSAHFGQDRLPSPKAPSAKAPYMEHPTNGFRPPYPSIQPSDMKSEPRQFHSSSPSLSPQTSHTLAANPAAAITRRGFYYQPGRISNEDVLVQRYAEQGLLIHSPLIKKKRRAVYPDGPPENSPELNDVLAFPPRSLGEGPTKKPKIPHRHGEFESRR